MDGLSIGIAMCHIAVTVTGILPRTVGLCSVRPSIGAENSIPEEMDHCEIGVRMSVMNEVQFLFASEPCKPLKPGSLYVVFFIEKNVRVERCGTCNDLNHEQINGQYEICTHAKQKHRNDEERRIVAFVTEIRLRDEMIFGIVSVMEIYVVFE